MAVGAYGRAMSETVGPEVVGSVAELWHFPVKSMQGSRVEVLDLTERGAEGDRGWAVVDPAEGKVLSAKRWSQLLEATGARADDGSVTVTLPDGSTHQAGDPATDAALSAWLDHDVRLIQPPEGDGLPYDLPTDAWDDTSPLWQFPGTAMSDPILLQRTVRRALMLRCARDTPLILGSTKQARP